MTLRTHLTLLTQETDSSSYGSPLVDTLTLVRWQKFDRPLVKVSKSPSFRRPPLGLGVIFLVINNHHRIIVQLIVLIIN